MPSGSLIALLDDIASVLDDVAVLTKVATKKTAGVLGDDLALNAEQVTGVRSERELPVVWAVAKGSLINKAILVPAALGISAVANWAVIPLLMLGGAFLCFEGFEKLAHKLFAKHHPASPTVDTLHKLSDPSLDLVKLEKEKIRGAIRTDFVLSAEIVTITLGTVAAAPFATRVGVLVGMALLMTVGVYGLVAGIVKLDDVGLYLSQKDTSGRVNGLSRRLGFGILGLAPYLMKGLSIAGTTAMFLVGGGILVHGIPGAESTLHHLTHSLGMPPSGLLESLASMFLNGAFGVIAGALVFGVLQTAKRLRGRAQST